MEEVERDIGANDISQLLSPVFLQKIYLTGEDRLKTQFNRQLYIPLRRRKSTRRYYVFFPLLQFLFFFFFPFLLESLFKMLPVHPQKERERREVCEKETSPLKRVLLPSLSLSLSLLSIGKYRRSIGRESSYRAKNASFPHWLSNFSTASKNNDDRRSCTQAGEFYFYARKRSFDSRSSIVVSRGDESLFRL